AARCSGPKWGTLISKWGARRVQLSCKWGTFGRSTTNNSPLTLDEDACDYEAYRDDRDENTKKPNDIQDDFLGRSSPLYNGSRLSSMHIDDANTWHLNIKLDYKIKKSLPFLDVLLTNNNGTLATSVYHKPAAEPYVTPFTSDHPRHVFANIIKTSLERATRYSSTFQKFNNERRNIKLMLLYNEHRLTFIENEFKKKFPEYISISPFLHFIDDENKYIHRRQK
ncbi:unnamed protein product, partial [Rotaria socialis]